MKEVGRSKWVVYGWRRTWRRGGAEALRRKPGPGKSLRLDARQWPRLSRALASKPNAVGVRAATWSLSTFADFVGKVAGRSCNRYMARRIMEALGYRFVQPPKPSGWKKRRGPGSWVKKYAPQIPAHLLPAGAEPR